MTSKFEIRFWAFLLLLTIAGIAGSAGYYQGVAATQKLDQKTLVEVEHRYQAILAKNGPHSIDYTNVSCAIYPNDRATVSPNTTTIQPPRNITTVIPMETPRIWRGR